MSDLFEHAKLKCRWGEQRARDLEKDLAAWLDPRPWAVEMRHDEATGFTLGIFRITRQPPLEFSLRAGEVAQHFRSALDYMVYALSEKHAGGRPLTGVEFPVFRDEALFRKTTGPGGGMWKIRHLPQPAKDLIERLQPFHLPEADRTSHLLWGLHDLSRIDKHRLLHTVVVATDLMEIRFETEGDIQIHDRRDRPPGPIEDGDELLRWRTTHTGDANVAVQPGFAPCTVIFDEKGPGRGGAVHDILQQLGQFVRGIGKALEDLPL